MTLRKSMATIRLVTSLLKLTPRCIRSATSASNPEEEQSFSCVSTKTVTPRRAFTGSHAPEPPDPFMCCGSGCGNCVWIEYGTQLVFYYSDKPIEEALKAIDERVADICMREFVKGEIRRKTRNEEKAVYS